jgi:hypothetical protein
MGVYKMGIGKKISICMVVLVFIFCYFSNVEGAISNKGKQCVEKSHDEWTFDLIQYAKSDLEEAIKNCYYYVINITKYERCIPQNNLCKDISKKIEKYNKLVNGERFDSVL